MTNTESDSLLSQSGDLFLRQTLYCPYTIVHLLHHPLLIPQIMYQCTYRPVWMSCFRNIELEDGEIDIVVQFFRPLTQSCLGELQICLGGPRQLSLWRERVYIRLLALVQAESSYQLLVRASASHKKGNSQLFVSPRSNAVLEGVSRIGTLSRASHKRGLHDVMIG